jgi:glycosyltransferase involved in cell wall biosynthesis
MKVSVCFTNFGPYHLARLRALAARLRAEGGGLVGYEVAGEERAYPWIRNRQDEPFTWTTFFPDRVLESIDAADCRVAMLEALDKDQPDAVCIVGYARPESMAAARWANRRGRPAVLFSESQAIDRPRVWWKELVKRGRICRFDSALVGGPPHRDYLVQLGMSRGRIALGYNAVDNDYFARAAQACRIDTASRAGSPAAPYFLSVCRFVPEKNLIRLVRAFASYRRQSDPRTAWDLVLCGDGLGAAELDAAIAASGWKSAIHRPGFVQADALPRWYSKAGALVLPSLSEPWGLVANEAAACGLPLLVSQRAGCATTLIPEPEGTTGAQFDPLDIESMTTRLAWMAALSESERAQMGRNAAETVSHWGPGQFARGALEALGLARSSREVRRDHRLFTAGKAR